MDKELIILLIFIYLINLQNSFNEISKKYLFLLLTAINEDPGKSVTYNNYFLHKNNSSSHNITSEKNNKVISTLEQIKKVLSSNSINNEYQSNIDATSTASQSIITKLPVLVGDVTITELLSGNIKFNIPIIAISSITNEVCLSNSNIIPDLSDSTRNTSIFYNGYVKTTLQTLEPKIINNNIIEALSSTYIIGTPFEGFKDIDLSSSIEYFNEVPIENLILETCDYTTNSDYLLTNPITCNDYVDFYDSCSLTINLEIKANILQSQRLRLGTPKYLKDYM